MSSVINLCRSFTHLHTSVKHFTRFNSMIACGGDISKTKNALFRKVSAPPCPSGKKVSIIGCGQCGVTTAYAILRSGFATELVLIDMNEKKAIGEMMDLTHCSTFQKFTKITAGSDLGLTACSKLVVIAAGPSISKGETRMDLIGKNTALLNTLVPQLVEHSPDCILICITNPADMIAYITWKISGFPFQRVMSTGTDLESSRFRCEIAQRLEINPYSVRGWVIGEHGDTCIPIWSSVTVAGVRLCEINEKIGEEDDPENWAQAHKNVVNAAYNIIDMKGWTNWAVSTCCDSLVSDIFTNSANIHAVSTNLNGLYGIEKDVFLSVPCVIGEGGIRDIVIPKLSAKEECQLVTAANKMIEIQNKLEINPRNKC